MVRLPQLTVLLLVAFVAVPVARAASYIDLWDFRQTVYHHDKQVIRQIRTHLTDVQKKPAPDHVLMETWYEDDFDTQGRIVARRRLKSKDGPVLENWAVEYNDAGQRSKITWYADGKPQYYEQASYNEDGQLVQIERHRATGKFGLMGTVTVEHQQERHDSLVGVTTKMDDGAPTTVEVFRFDRRDRLLQETALTTDYKPKYRHQWEWSRKGELVGEDFFTADAATGELVQVGRYDYTFEVDEQGNWTKWVTTHKFPDRDQRKLVVTSEVTRTREITYYTVEEAAPIPVDPRVRRRG